MKLEYKEVYFDDLNDIADYITSVVTLHRVFDTRKDYGEAVDSISD